MLQQPTADELRARLDDFLGGSEGRYRHWAYPKFIYTEGVKAMADTAHAYWLLDIVATELAPVCMEHWTHHGDTTHFFKVVVKDERADLSLLRDSDKPAMWFRRISYTDFPEGEWVFELSIDGMFDPDFDVVVMLLLQEH